MYMSNIQIVTAVFVLIFGLMAGVNIVFPPARVGEAVPRPVAAAAPNVAQPAPAPPAAPVDSWNKFVETAKSRINAAEERWNGKHPKAKQTITIIRDDVKKSDSLKSPFCGEIICKERTDYDETELRDERVRALEKERKFYADLVRGYVEQGINNKNSREAAKSVEDKNEEIRGVRRQPTHRINEWECTFQFGLQGQSWVLTSADVRKTEDSMARENVGQANKINKLTDAWMLELFQ